MLNISPQVVSITGTSNQVIADVPNGAVTLSLPQSIATSSTPQFARLGLGAAADATSALTVPTGTSANPSLLFTGTVAGFYIKNQGSTNQIVAVTSGADSSFMFQNLTSTGFSGPSYLDNTGTVGVFTGLTNNTGEFRFNNVATSAAISFEISSSKKLQITNAGSIILGSTAALATNATGGFAYIPTCAGTPTGVPTSATGKVAMVYDTTNNKFYCYNGAWKGVTLA